MYQKTPMYKISVTVLSACQKPQDNVLGLKHIQVLRYLLFNRPCTFFGWPKCLFAGFFGSSNDQGTTKKFFFFSRRNFVPFASLSFPGQRFFFFMRARERRARPSKQSLRPLKHFQGYYCSYLFWYFKFISYLLNYTSKAVRNLW